MTMRLFVLRREIDVSGVSGCGEVAEGVEFEDGTCVVQWKGSHRSTVVWRSIADVIHVHGHGGATKVVFETCTHPGCRITEKHQHGRQMSWVTAPQVPPAEATPR